MIPHTLGHYRILRKLGAGGMGEVYLARDERLERDVAIKVLPPGLLSDEAARKQFRKEALALSKLNHPNIATIHDFDSQGGVDFLAMENVPGESLTQKIKAGAMPEKEIASLGVQIAEALEEAHEQGIVHRDLKPGNIVVTPKGRVKVLDFGLAKLLRPTREGEATASVTQTHGVAGTLPYMAPEQLRGEPVDFRSDIFTFGAVLYEMGTAQRAFPEEITTRLTDAILHQVPVAPRALNPRISPELERIILKCLEKEPENRYQSAKEIAVDLRRLASGPATAASEPAISQRFGWRWVVLATGIAALVAVVVLVSLYVSERREQRAGNPSVANIRSLAVLPLQNFSHDAEQDYFADGMTEALVTNLSKINSLRVISRTSVMHYKGSNETLPQIARELNVDAVVEGSVERSGDRVRITAQLIQAATDQHLWADSYVRDLRDVLALQDEIARDIAQEIRVQLTPQEQAHLASARPVDTKTYELYLKGRFYLSQGTSSGSEKSGEYFEQAIAKDPSYAPAYAGLARFYRRAAGVGLLTPQEAWPKAEAAAERALELDETLAEAHAEIAQIRLYRDWNWAAAEKEDKRALELNPNSADVHSSYAYYLRCVGRLNQALEEDKRALELDPLRVDLSNQLGYDLIFAGKYDEAIDHFRKSLELDPNAAVTRYLLARTYEIKKMYKEAAAESIGYLNLLNEKASALRFERIYKSEGYQAAARFLDQQDVTEEKKRPHPDPWILAYSYARLGETDQAFKWLERAYHERSGGLLQIKTDPDVNSLRSDPRYQDLVRRIGFPP